MCEASRRARAAWVLPKFNIIKLFYVGFNLVKFIQASVPVNQDAKIMEIADWRNKIDELDRRMVDLLNERAQAAHEIGKLKRNTSMPIYEPEREKRIFENVLHANRGPLPDGELRTVYERIIDVMRNIQKNEIAPKVAVSDGRTEFDTEVND